MDSIRSANAAPRASLLGQSPGSVFSISKNCDVDTPRITCVCWGGIRCDRRNTIFPVLALAQQPKSLSQGYSSATMRSPLRVRFQFRRGRKRRLFNLFANTYAHGLASSLNRLQTLVLRQAFVNTVNWEFGEFPYRLLLTRIRQALERDQSYEPTCRPVPGAAVQPIFSTSVIGPRQRLPSVFSGTSTRDSAAGTSTRFGRTDQYTFTSLLRRNRRSTKSVIQVGYSNSSGPRPEHLTITRRRQFTGDCRRR